MSKDELSVETRGRHPKKIGDRIIEDIAAKRICHVYGIFGETGGGKTHQTKIEAHAYAKTVPGVRNGEKVLVFDTNGEYLQKDGFTTISLHHVEMLQNVGLYRVNARGWSDEEKKAGALLCAKKFKRGLYVVDDIDKWAPFETNKEFTSLMMGGRHEGVDLALSHQSLDMGTTIFYRNALSIRLHNQASNLAALKSKAEKHLPILQISENIVNKQYELGNYRFFVTINLRKKKIFGVPLSHKNAFMHACKMYLISNPGLVKEAAVELVAENKLKHADMNREKGKNMAFQQALNKLDFFYGVGDFHQ